ncbi:MAG: beta-propeller fold lactonase family protein [Acetobacteraceae bacterium]|nr:beta-propeller fold lactonase family protein [Acetobacteraceae bacterium]
MTLRQSLLTLLLVPALSTGSAQAGTNDVLIGLDQKITYDANGQVNGPPGKDAVLVMDVSNPMHPKIRASLPLMNSLLGPPTNLQITPDGKLGLVANSVVNVQEGNAWKTQPDDKLFVIDLTANPPKLIDTVTVGKQPSGLSISHKGDLALIANRAGKSVSVGPIQGNSVKAVGEVPMDNEVAAVVIAPDGKRAFACMNLANKIGVLSIEGQNVTYDKAMDIPAAFNPYNIDITPDGKYVVVSNTGARFNNADAEVIIEATGPHPHVVDLMSPGIGPEGFAISPNGKWAAAPLLLGTSAKPSDWFYTKAGELVLMSVALNGKLNVVSRTPLGGLPEGIAYSPNSDYLYVGNFLDSDLQVFHIQNGKLTPVGGRIKLTGQPASMRGRAR